MADQFPLDLLLEIFHRLPNKSIGMSMCACKYWLSLIKDPLFISNHLKHQKSGNIPSDQEPMFLLKTTSKSKEDTQIQFSYHLDDEKFSEHKRLVNPMDDPAFTIVGSSNGLVCFMRKLESNSCSFVLWNPLLRKSIVVPYPGSPSNGIFSGFGYDRRTNDYNIMRIVRLEDEAIMGTPTHVEIFSLNSNSWKNITRNYPQQYETPEKGSQAFVNEAIHWIAQKRDENGDLLSLVLTFDFVTERFREIPIPESLTKEDARGLSVMAHKDSTISVSKGKNPFESEGELWVMKEYGVTRSWARAMVFGRSLGGVPLPLGFRKDGAILFQLHDGFFASVHPRGLEVKDLDVKGAPGCSFLEPFLENLALLDKFPINPRNHKFLTMV